jgi:hypothetical protein
VKSSGETREEEVVEIAEVFDGYLQKGAQLDFQWSLVMKLVWVRRAEATCYAQRTRCWNLNVGLNGENLFVCLSVCLISRFPCGFSCLSVAEVVV